MYHLNKMDNKKEIEERQKIISAFKKNIKMPDAEAEWQKVAKKIDQNETEAKETSVSASASTNYQKGNYAISGIAAGITILLALASIFAIYTNYTAEPIQEEMSIKEVFQEYDFTTDYGENRTFSLSDGSTIILNANSRLKFTSSADAGDVTTEVWLEGEAYFDIAHLEGDKSRTFTVHTPDGAVEVLGTRFVVNTYNKETQAILEEGKIAIKVGVGVGEQAENSSGQQKIYYLNPGGMATFNAGRHRNGVTIKKVKTAVYTSWTENKMVFDETPLTEVAKRIEQYFGIEVIIGKAAIETKLSGSIKTDNLKVLTEALKKILDQNYVKLQGNTVHIQ